MKAALSSLTVPCSQLGCKMSYWNGSSKAGACLPCSTHRFSLVAQILSALLCQCWVTIRELTHGLASAGWKALLGNSRCLLPLCCWHCSELHFLPWRAYKPQEQAAVATGSLLLQKESTYPSYWESQVQGCEHLPSVSAQVIGTTTNTARIWAIRACGLPNLFQPTGAWTVRC